MIAWKSQPAQPTPSPDYQRLMPPYTMQHTHRKVATITQGFVCFTYCTVKDVKQTKQICNFNEVRTSFYHDTLYDYSHYEIFIYFFSTTLRPGNFLLDNDRTHLILKCCVSELNIEL